MSKGFTTVHSHGKCNIRLFLIIKHFNNTEESKIHTKCYNPGDLLPAISLWAEAHVVL